MSKLLILINKNKYIKICLCFVLCLVVIVNCISPAFRPKAVALVDDILLVLAMFCLSMGIQIATDPPDWGNTLQPLYDALSDYAQDQIRGISVLGTGLYCYVYNCEC